MDIAIIKSINEARSSRRSVAVVTTLSTGQQELVKPEQVQGHALESELAARFQSGKSGMVSADQSDHFVQVHVPAPRLVIIGAVHISQALFPMAQACEFDVTIVDPRSAFATKDRFVNVELIDDWPAEVWDKIKPDAYTAVAAVTHDPKIDDFALQNALASNCFYVGALGSRKTHAKRVARLLEQGVSQTDIEKIHSPIGVDIGAANPAEIAVAIMAEIIGRLRKGTDA